MEDEGGRVMDIMIDYRLGFFGIDDCNLFNLFNNLNNSISTIKNLILITILTNIDSNIILALIASYIQILYEYSDLVFCSYATLNLHIFDDLSNIHIFN